MNSLALAVVAAASAQAPPPRTFNVGVEGVYVDVFVTDGNRPVVGLTAADFELKDALHDALYAGTLLASGRGRSLLVLFTDGEDNLSWLGADEVRRVLIESNVLVQAVGIVPNDETRDAPGPRPRPPSETPHARTLRQLAEATGGRFWAASAPDRLADAFLAILKAMKTRYVLRFEPDRVRREGRHELEVKLVRRKGKVHCRKAYFAGPPSP